MNIFTSLEQEENIVWTKKLELGDVCLIYCIATVHMYYVS